MPSERVQRQVDALLDDAERAIRGHDWESVRKASESALRLDPDNQDALAYLTAAQRPPQAPSIPESPKAVPMPASLATKVRSEIGRVEGERRTVTVLFADARNFTGQSERLDEEAVYEAMRACLQVMADSVYEVEGTITQFRGDGIMAIFGAPIAHEDAARRGVMAALRMQERLKALADDLGKTYGFDPSFRVGLNTGPVVVGTINDQLEMDFTALGDTVNLAARMEQAGEPGAVTITIATERAIRGYFECEELARLDVKGKAEPVQAYRVIRETGARTRLEAKIASGLSEFTGRDHELDVLGSYLELARDRRPQAVLVSGEAGIGKSRLLHEFRGRAEASGARWLQGQCSPLATRIPYFPVIEMVRQILGLRDESGHDDVIRAVDEYVAGLAPGNEPHAPYLRFLLTGSAGDDRIDGMDPIERRVGMMDALQSVFAYERRSRPVVLVVEDLHWIDERSEAVIDALASTHEAKPLLFVGTMRPGYQGSLTQRSDLARLALAQLPGENCHAIASSLLGAERLPTGFDDWLASRTGGNPLFVEEVVRSLAESNAVVVDDAGARLTRPFDSLAIPDTVQGVILSRIDRLTGPAKEAIQLASVIGREFSVPLLDRLVAAEGQALEPETLAGLRTLELIREKQQYPEGTGGRSASCRAQDYR